MSSTDDTKRTIADVMREKRDAREAEEQRKADARERADARRSPFMDGHT